MSVTPNYTTGIGGSVAKLPERNQRLTEDGGKMKCDICREPIEDGEQVWWNGKPAHEDCACEEGMEL